MRSAALSIVFLASAACSIEQPPWSVVGSPDLGLDRTAGPAPVATVDPAPVGTPAPPQRASSGLGPYAMLRLAAFEPTGDINSLDTGWAGELSYGNQLLSFLAIEAAGGYFEADSSGSGKLWGIPLFVNARASLPILFLEPYAGAGVGGIYTDFPGDTDWVAAWNAFAGLGVVLGQLSLGADYHYIRSRETSGGFEIEAHEIGAFVTFPF